MLRECVRVPQYGSINDRYWILRVVSVSRTVLRGTALVGLLLVALSAGLVGTAAATDTAPTCSNISYSTNSSGWYEVTNVSQLQCIESNGLDKNYVLTSDENPPDFLPQINASGTSKWNDDGSGAKGFDPIGDGGTPFTGSFDGRGHTISDLYINRAGTSSVGLFAYVDGGYIKNISVENADITGSNEVGGLVGKNTGGTVAESYAAGTVSGSNKVGGLAGQNNNKAAITTSHAAGTVSGSDRVGGLVGFNAFNRASVTKSYATSDVTGSTHVGGLVGDTQLSSSTKITASYATGNVSGDTDVGGLVGTVGDPTVDTSYATGDVSGTTNVGGLIGNSEGGVSDSYWDKGTTNQSDAIGSGSGTNLTGFGSTNDTSLAPEITGLNATVRMTNFDFDSTWRPGDGDDRSPDLAWDSSFVDTAEALDSLVAGDGAGTPYEITTVYELQSMRYNLSANYKLLTDVDASITANWYNASGDPKGFEPVGTDTAEFRGSFEGGGHAISDLYIDRESTKYVGLFGVVRGGTVENVGVENVDVTGNFSVAGLVGKSANGAISGSYVTGNLTGFDDVLGGLVGRNLGSATVIQSYATADINGSDSSVAVGGLVGDNRAEVTSSYATGEVSGSSIVGGLVGWNYEGSVSESYAIGVVNGYTSANIGGLVGDNVSVTDPATVSSSYWNTETTTQSSSDGGDPLTTGQMTGIDALDSGNMDGFTDSDWDVHSARDYPTLAANAQTPPPTAPLYAGGDGTATSPYQIGTWAHLDAVRQNPNANFTLVADLNASAVGYDTVASASANGDKGFEPIGNQTAPFTGSFDGNGSTISDLYIDRENANYVGLFGRINDGRIENVSVENVTIVGSTFVGGLVGQNGGTVTASTATGNVSGSTNVGGLVGSSTITVSASSATGTVSGSTNVGGLVGKSDGTVSASNATGTVSGSTNVGGLVGSNTGPVSHSNATSNVSSTSQYVGGLVGSNTGPVSASSATGNVSSTSNYVGGLVGANFGTTVSESYATGAVDGSNFVGGLVGNSITIASEASVTKSYATGTVNGSDSVGGLVGANQNGATISESYAVGAVNGSIVGGLVGSNAATVSNSYWNTETTNRESSAGGTPLTTAEMTGSDALDSGNMDAFTDAWNTNANSDDTLFYPTLTANAQTPPPSESLYAGGSGTDTSPYQIETWEQLDAVRENLGANFTLVADLSASTAGYDTVVNNRNNGFMPIGDENTHFTGSFDGNGLTISDLSIDRESRDNVGLFGVSEGRLEAVSVENVDVTGGSNVGGLVGQNDGGTVTASSATGTVSGVSEVGGLVGWARGGGTVTTSDATSNVSGSTIVGGLVGLNNLGSKITDSNAAGSISGSTSVGGLVGLNTGSVDQSSAASEVNGSKTHTGGLVGQHDAGNLAIIKASHATGNVSGSTNVGGLVGSSNDTVRTSYATGNVSGSTNVGGLLGRNFDANITTSYATGDVDGSEFVGGLVGHNQNDATVNESYAVGAVNGSIVGGLVGQNNATVSNSYWNTETTNRESSAGGTPLTTAEMTGSDALDSSNMNAFTTAWSTTANSDDTLFYPTLAVNAQTPPPSTPMYAGGDGTATSPYQIETWQQLDAVRENLGANFTLVADLNASTAGYNTVANASANGDKGFEPIGDIPFEPFTGSFDGNGSTIADLTISRESTNNVGLFAGSEGQLENVSLENVDVTGSNYVGGLVARNSDGGTVSASSVTGNVSGSDVLGGLVGENRGTVTASYATANVSGSDVLGGLVGENRGTTTESYATGAVTGENPIAGGLIGKNDRGTITDSYAIGTVSDSGSGFLGGLVGQADGGTVSDSYWDKGTTNQNEAIGVGSETSLTGFGTVGVAEPAAEMTGADALGDGNMDALNESVWNTTTDTLIENETLVERVYPTLVSNPQTPPPGGIAQPAGSLYAGGSGTATSPYQINNWTQFDAVRENLEANFTLVADLNASTAGYNTVANASANGDKGFEPIGNQAEPFTGSFDGNGSTIADLTISRESTDYVGLFGVSEGRLGNVSVENVDVTGSNYVGGLVASNNDGGTVSASSVTGNIFASDFVGGLVGENGGTVTASSATGDISGSNRVGGLVGENSGGTITASYATGNVSGSDLLGGLVGFNSGTTTESYATGAVTGESAIAGGLVGQTREDGTITESYAIGSVSVSGSGSYAGGLVGDIDNGTVSDSYWDRGTTDQSAATGRGDGTNLTGFGTIGVDGPAAEMTGSDALDSGSMDALNQSVWVTSANSDDIAFYPTLAANAQTPPPSGLLYAGGNGTVTSPYQIETWQHLDAVRQNLGANFTLVADLNASTAGYDTVASASANGDRGFEPIGNQTTPFTGSFDGNGSTISDLFIDRENANYVGLFGRINDGRIENVSVENVTIVGSTFVGGLVGLNDNSEVTASYATGNVSASSASSIVGGLVGQNQNGATVRESYATGAVNGSDRVGGLVGLNDNSEVTVSYATGNLSGSEYVGGLVGDNNGGEVTVSYATGDVDGSEFVGGLVGQNQNGATISESYAVGAVNGSTVGGLVGSNAATVSNSYWNTKTTNQESSAGGIPLTTAQMTGRDALDSGNMDGFTDAWNTNANSDDMGFYPTLAANAQTPPPGEPLVYAGGSGTDTSPYQIGTWQHLDAVRQNLDANFTLVADLNASTAGYNTVASASANGDRGFEPIGNQTTPFTGSFDGNGSTISDLSIDRGEMSGVGLFGFVENGTVEDVGIENVDVTGDEAVGGLAAVNINGEITASYVTGNVLGSDIVGGLVGLNQNATVSESYATSNIDGSNSTGGLVGINNGIITVSNATGAVDGSNYVGGLAGKNTGGEITESYAAGNVNATDFVGGLVGQNTNAIVSASHAAGTVDGSSTVGGLVGEYTNGGTVTGSYATGEVVGASNYVGGLIGQADGGTVSASNATGNVSGASNYVGGLIGQADSVTISASSATGTVSGDSDYVGGLIGANANGDVSRSYATGDTDGSRYAGGLVGQNDNVTVSASNATGAVTGSERVGGLVGEHREGNITESYATGNLSGSEYVGGLVGANTGTTISEAYATGDITGENADTGGLVGWNDGGTVTASNATGSVSGSERVGGLVGNSSGTVSESYATGNVSGTSQYVGGLIGKTDGGTVKKSYATGNVSGDRNYVGGLVGQNRDATLTESYATGNASGDSDYVGGLVGANVEGGVKMSYATGNVTGSNEVGGLVGFNTFSGASVTKSYAIGSVTGVENVGGLVGDNGQTVSDSYWDKGTTNQNEAIGSGSGTNLTGFGSVGVDGPAAKMTGSDALADGNMDALNDSMWQTHTDTAVENETRTKRVYPTLVSNPQTPPPSGLTANAQTPPPSETPGEGPTTVNETYTVTVEAGVFVVDGASQANLTLERESTYRFVVDASGHPFHISTASGGGNFINIYTNGVTVTNPSNSNANAVEKGNLTFSVPSDAPDVLYYVCGIHSGMGGRIDIVDADTTREDSNTSTPGEPLYAGGSGTATSPYQINNWTQLDAVRENLDANFTLVADLNASTAGYNTVASASANGDKGFEPIGNQTTPFTGSFDGNGSTISDLSIDRESTNYVGVFGASTGRLENVSVENVTIVGSTFVGGLVGENTGTVSESYTTGTVSGSADGVNGTAYYVGGLVGANGGEVKTSYATGSVSGDHYTSVGGLVGANINGEVKMSYATGNVTGSEDVGGLVGTIETVTSVASVTNSYATGSVTGVQNVGGFVGNNRKGTVSDSYWDKGTTGENQTAGGSTNVTGFGVVGVAEPAANMTGSDALADGNMDALNESVWQTTADATIENETRTKRFYPTLVANPQTPPPSGLAANAQTPPPRESPGEDPTTVNETYTVTVENGVFVVDGDSQANLTLERGSTYRFDVDANNHPFHIATSPGGGNFDAIYTDGVTVTNPSAENVSAVEVGNLTFTVPSDAPDTLYYVCGIHAGMGARIDIVDRNTTGGDDDGGDQAQGGSSGGDDDNEGGVDTGTAPAVKLTTSDLDSSTLSALDVTYNATGEVSSAEDLAIYLYNDTDSATTPIATRLELGSLDGRTILTVPSSAIGGGTFTARVTLVNASAGDAELANMSKQIVAYNNVRTSVTDGSLGGEADGAITVAYNLGNLNPANATIRVSPITFGQFSIQTASPTKNQGTVTVPVDKSINSQFNVQTEIVDTSRDRQIQSSLGYGCVGSQNDPCPSVNETATTVVDATTGQPVDVEVNTTLDHNNGGVDWYLHPAGSPGEKDISTVAGVNTSTPLRVMLTVDDFDPVIIVGTGDADGWEKTTVDGDTKRISINVTPAEAHWEPDIQNPDPREWPLNNHTASAQYGAVVDMMAVSMEGQVNAGYRNRLDGTFIGTDAQAFSVPSYDEAGNGSLEITVASPHYEVDGGTVNDGFYRAVIPKRVLTAWGVTPEQLTATYKGKPVAGSSLTVENRGNSVYVSMPVTYSSGVVRLSGSGSEASESGDDDATGDSPGDDTGSSGSSSGGSSNGGSSSGGSSSGGSSSGGSSSGGLDVTSDVDPTSSLQLEAANIESITPELDVGSNQQVATTELVEGVKLVAFHTPDRIEEITVTDVDPTTAQVNPPGDTATVQEISVPENVTNQSATLVFTVPSQRVKTLGGSVDRLSVVRLTDDGWQLLDTTVVEQTDTAVTLEAETPGFSVFAVTAVGEPEATATVNTEVATVGEPVTLDGTSSSVTHGEIVSHTWMVAGRSLSGETQTVTFEESGDYTVELTVMTDAGETDSTTVSVSAKQSILESQDHQSTEASESVTNATDSSAAMETTSESAPGFGLLVAVIALLVLAFAMSRRGRSRP
ncbi:PGF-pre-PGF domain-containing protein [Halobellus sp. Atlit-31R]|nr:PGF-pre-PGF domain-containing protein [Halobellus sp. Atlit-31R]